ncbi:MAG TPA: hypothetical protein VE988_11145 [Gemmataceae bacterium]|nr:hypothetical protein [Gemmataceae bacterium]
MNRVKLTAKCHPALRRLSGLLTLLMAASVCLLVPSETPVAGIAPLPLPAPVLYVPNDDDENLPLEGDDLFATLAADGLQPSELPEPQIIPRGQTQPTKTVSLPLRHDNSASKYFPPIMQQKGGSCAQASGIHYNFTYEMNLARGLDSKLPQNQYPDHWTWNCLNQAELKGSNYAKGWAVVKEIGVPTLDVYGDKFGMHADAGWPSGYDKYYAAMKNRVDSYGSFPIKTPEDLQKIKRYLYNHDDPNQKVGGLLSFSMNFKGRKTVKIPAGSYEAGKQLVTKWGDSGGHAMTFIGYDDNIAFDVNGDGKITNDKDLNGDGKITLADWEKGAFIFANSHGTKSFDGGKGYVQYRLVGIPKADGGQNPSASWVKVKKDYQPRTTMLLRFKFEDRAALQLTAGFASGMDATKANATVQPGVYNGKFNVGKVPMRGKNNNEPIEIGIDLTDIAPEVAGKFFLHMGRKNGSEAKGELMSAAIYRYDSQGMVVSVSNFSFLDGKFGDKSLDVALVARK